MKYPVLAFAPNGFTHLFHSESETQRMCIGYIGIYKRHRSAMQFFDSESVIWKLSSIQPTQRVWFWQRMFGALQHVDVLMEFERVGSYSVDDFRRAFRRAVDADDDILTQHEDINDICQKLEAVQSVPEVFRLYRWMRKDFRKGA